MSGEVIVQLPEEKTTEIVEEKTVIEEALEVVEVATKIAEIIDEAKENEDEQVFEVMAKLDTIITNTANLEISFAAIMAKLDDLKATEVAEIIVEQTPAEIEQTAAVKDVIEETEPPTVIEEVPVAVTPQIKKKKSTRWL